MLDYVVAVVLIFAALIGWLKVQETARRFAARHPQLGPAREEGGGCGSSCSCSQGQCSSKHEVVLQPQHREHAS